MHTQIDFEDFQAGTYVRDQYGSRGAYFPTFGVIAVGGKEGKPHSGTNYLVLPYGGPPKTLVFSASPSDLSLWVGTFDAPQGAAAWCQLEARDAGGTLIGGETKELVVNACDTQLQVNAPGKYIASATLTLVGIDANGMAFPALIAIDDLAFDVELQKIDPPHWYNPWWWLGQPVPPIATSAFTSTFPREKWAQNFAAALHAAETAQMATDSAVRKEAESVARRLAEIAAESLKGAVKMR